MDEIKGQYLLFLSELISKMIIVFGYDVTIQKAQAVSGLVVDNKGAVTDIKGFTADSVEELVNSYVKLSDAATKNIIEDTFNKYPQIKRIG